MFCWYTEKVFASFSQCGLARYISFSAEQASSFKIGGVFSLIWSMVWEVAVLLVSLSCLCCHVVAGQFRSPLQPGFPTWYLFTGVSSSCPGALSRRVWLSSSIWRNSWTFPSSRSFVVRINVLGHVLVEAFPLGCRHHSGSFGRGSHGARLLDIKMATPVLLGLVYISCSRPTTRGVLGVELPTTWGY